MKKIILMFLFLSMFSINCFATPQIVVKSYDEFKDRIKNCLNERLEKIEFIYIGDDRSLGIVKTGNPTKDEYFIPKLKNDILNFYSPTQYNYYQFKDIYDDIKYIDSDLDYKIKHLHIILEIDYYMNAEQTRIAEKALAKLEKELTPIIKYQYSNYQKVVVIHNKVLEQLTYFKNERTSYSIFGALLENKGVCMSYGLLFQRLCEYFNIPCKIVVGDILESNRDAKHMWNMVKLYGQWYHVDTTWDDTDDKKSYKYFLKSDEFMKSETAGIRMWKWKLYPKCEENF